MENSKSRKRLDEVESRVSVLEESVNRAVGTPMPKVDALLAERSEGEEASSAARSATSASGSTSLVELARRGDHEALLGLLVDTGIDVRRNLELTEMGDTPLHVAAREGHAKAVMVLLGAGAKVNAPGCQQRTPLHCAAAHGHLAVAQRLLIAGAQVDAKDADGATPLEALAAGRGKKEMVLLLLQKGAKPSGKAVFLAAECGHCDLVEFFLQNKSGFVNSCNEGGEPLIVHAARANRWDVVDVLLEKGASATKCKETKESALVLASEGGQADAVRELLRRGADKNKEQVDCALKRAKNAAVVWAFVDVVPHEVRGDSGKMGLCQAAINGRLETLIALLKAGVNVNARNRCQKTALLFAAGNGHVACVRELIQRGADVNLKNNLGNTPLHRASFNGHVECVRALLDAGASSKEKNNNGDTPLHDASFNGHVECVRALLDAGASSKEKNKDGDTPLHDASSNGHVECVRALLDARARTTERNKQGKTPLQVACSDNVRILLNGE